MPLGQIDLPITFGDQFNYRTETLTFGVGRPCYAKFMAVPNYTYLKLKISGPRGVITIGTCFQHAYECEVECCEHAATIVTSKELAAIKEEVGWVFWACRGCQGGPHRLQWLQGQSGAHWHHTFLQIGKRAHQLPPRQ